MRVYGHFYWLAMLLTANSSPVGEGGFNTEKSLKKKKQFFLNNQYKSPSNETIHSKRQIFGDIDIISVSAITWFSSRSIDIRD